MTSAKLAALAGLVAIGGVAVGAETSYVNGGNDGSAVFSHPDQFTFHMESCQGAGGFAGWLIDNPAYGAGGTVSFDWTWSSSDSQTGYDYPVTTLNGQADYNGSGFAFPPSGSAVPNGFDFNAGMSQSGSGSFTVNPFDNDFGFAVRQDGCCGNGTLDITNYTFTPVPAPGAVALLGIGGLAARRRRR